MGWWFLFASWFVLGFGVVLFLIIFINIETTKSSLLIDSNYSSVHDCKNIIIFEKELLIRIMLLKVFCFPIFVFLVHVINNLIYFQTGSGKTYSMGTGFDMDITPEEVGIIPRAVGHLFSGIDNLRRTAFENNEQPPEFKVNAQFMEVSLLNKCFNEKYNNYNICIMKFVFEINV